MVVSSIADWASGASSTNVALNPSFIRIRQDAPGVVCSLAMNPSLIQRCGVERASLQVGLRSLR
jgi:hypothetical protein